MYLKMSPLILKGKVMNIDDLRKQGLIILECISGSKAYGLDTPTSDTDIKGVFVMPKKDYYGLEYIPQISDERNDVVFYEWRRFLELLSVNNPNILELLNTPSEAVLYKHPFLDDLEGNKILSKLCQKTFGRFAMAQIKKAKGLNKKILNPMSKDRKDILAFCYINQGQGSIALSEYLSSHQIHQEQCGLVNLSNMKNVFGLYHDEGESYAGIMKSQDSNEVQLSAIPKGKNQRAILYFNKEGYSTYCKEYLAYWNWVNTRNEDRYLNTINHGKRYDAKNMMHTFRLLNMAKEIALERRIHVKRKDRDFLLKIKSGHFEYDELLAKANVLFKEMEEAFEQTNLPASPDLDWINEVAFSLREKFYTSRTN